MKNLTTLLIVVLSTQLSFSQTQYSRVKIYTSDVGLIQLSALGVAVDHGTHKKNTFFIGDLSSDEIAILDQNGF